jgi:hypothetical protein
MATIPKGINKLQRERWAKFEAADIGITDTSDTQVIIQDSITDILIKFITAVKSQVQENLNATSKTGQQSLYNSVQVNVEETGNTVSVQLVMNDYWKYVDKGVKGRKSTYPESADSPFAYPQKPKSSGGKFQNSLELWIAQKPIQIRTSTTQSGAAVRNINSSIAYAIRNKIIDRGIRATNFFSSVINDQSIAALREETEKRIGKKLEIALTTFKRQ